MTIEDAIKLYESYGVEYFKTPFMLNMFNVRNSNSIFVLWYDERQPHLETFEAECPDLPFIKNIFVFGKHRGKYPALVLSGNRSIDIHHSAVWSIPGTMTKNYPGSQVINRMDDWKRFMKLVYRQMEKQPGYFFTYCQFTGITK